MTHPLSRQTYSACLLVAGEVAFAAEISDAFRRAGPGLIVNFQDFRELVDRSLVQDQLLAGVSSFFGVLAVLLSTLGLYGAIAFAVARRTKEIGLRMALGANPRGILRMVFGEACALVAIGCAAGGALALLSARAISTPTTIRAGAVTG